MLNNMSNSEESIKEYVTQHSPQGLGETVLIVNYQAKIQQLEAKLKVAVDALKTCKYQEPNHSVGFGREYYFNEVAVAEALKQIGEVE